MESFVWWSDEEKKLSAKVKEFVDEIIPIAEEAWWERKFPWSALKRLGEEGYFGAGIPKEFGGMGLGTTGTCIVSEETGRILGVAKILGGSMVGGVHQILEFGTEEQKRRFLPRIAKGEIGAICITEPFVGSDASAIETTAHREGNRYIINGKKRYTTGVGVANRYMLYARTSDNPEDQRRHKHLTAFVVEKGMPGFSVEKINELIGLDNIPNGFLDLDNVPVPLDNRIGEEGEGWRIMMSGLDWERLIMSTNALGYLREAIRVVVPYAQRRIQFGRPTITLVNNQMKIADIIMTLKMARLSTYYAAHLLDLGQSVALESSIAKVFNFDMCFQMMVDAIQIMGGDGATKFYPIEKLLRESKVDHIAGGTNEINRLVIFRTALATMAEDLKMPRRVIHKNIGVPIITNEKPEKKALINEVDLLKVLADDYRINPGLYMTREDLKEEFDVDDENLDNAMMSLEQKGMIKTYRGRKGIELAKSTYEGLRKANPNEHYRWFPSWVSKEDIF